MLFESDIDRLVGYGTLGTVLIFIVQKIYFVNCFSEMAEGGHNEFVFDDNIDEFEEFVNYSLRPVFNPVGSYCNVPNCNSKFARFPEYVKHWKMVHKETIYVYSCNICQKRFRRKERGVSYAGFIHRRKNKSECVSKIGVKNYCFKDTYGAWPYRRGTSEERHEILQKEKGKAQEERHLLAQKIRRERGLDQ